jgi:hypothetical protein
LQTRGIECSDVEQVEHPALKLTRSHRGKRSLAFLRGETVDESANTAPVIIDGWFYGLSQSGHDLGEGQLDGI